MSHCGWTQGFAASSKPAPFLPATQGQTLSLAANPCPAVPCLKSSPAAPAFFCRSTTVAAGSRARGRFASGRIYAAGGLRDVSDFKLLQEARAEGILVASALHEGRLTSAHLAALESESAARGHK